MTQEKFSKYNKSTAYCECCKKDRDIKLFSYRNLRDNGTAKFCNICEWMRVHGGIPIIDGVPQEKIQYVIEYMLARHFVIVNDIAKKIETSLETAINIINVIHIGNRDIKVRTHCAYCGKEILKHISVYLHNQYCYCSHECYGNHKTEVVPKGKNSPFYNKIKTHCTNCGKEISVIPYDYAKTNKFHDNHNFCSQQCYWDYRKKYYHGEKAACYNLKLSPERKEKMRMNFIKSSKSNNRFNSKIQLIVNDILDNNMIQYEREYPIKYYAIDNYLPKYNLTIEVMGDYWHCSPLKYNDLKYRINSIQQRTIHHDKIKYSYLVKKLGIEILYLWEADILHQRELCEKLIVKYIQENGKLNNYHSFNYEVVNGHLQLKQNLIVPYQQKNIETYRYLFKEKSEASPL